MNHLVAHPLMPLPVKYSDFARKDIGRSSMSGRKTESITDRWFEARIAAPCFGTFSAPEIQGRNSPLTMGPTNTCLRIQ